MNRKRDWAGVVLALFFSSGATALVYEVVWSKFLSQMFGSTIQAQTVVLAVFMGGLALGNRLVGRVADSLRQPLRAYGFIEIAIGLYAAGFIHFYGLADHIFVAAGSRVLDHGWLLLSLKGLLSVALLLGPTILMGGTLPLLAAWLQKSSVDAGQRSARFYAVNSLGAVAGAWLAGFHLVQSLGMVATLQLTALANAVIGGLAILLSGQWVLAAHGSADAATSQPATAQSVSSRLRWVVVLAAATGAVSMGLEVLASRSLSLIFGSSLEAFAIMLMAFILGIGLGSSVVASPRANRWPGERVVIGVLLGAAIWIGLLVFKIESWVEVYRYAKSGLARSTIGHTYYQFLAAGLSLVVLGVPAALIGSVLPLLIRAVSQDATALGRHVGRLLTWNTCGAVAGVLATGFVLMPQVGLRNSFGVLAISLCGVTAWVAWRLRLRGGLALSGVAAALLLGLLTFAGEGWRHVMSSGVFRAKETEVNPQVMALRKAHIRILFYEDAPDATVSVECGDGVGAPADLGLRINGKTDASSRGDLCTQLLMAHLPLLAKPDSREVFILGLGSGITAGAVLGHPVRQVTIAENCEPVVRAAKLFEPWNRGVLTNAQARIWLEDARTILKLSPQKYDVIITQPSNPWMAGVGSVFSKEYYELGASRLHPGGVLAQWFHLYDMHDGIVELVLRTFGSVFPYVEVWDCGTGDIILLGSDVPWPASVAAYQKLFQREQPRQDLASIGIPSPAALLARQLASQRTGFAIPAEGPVQSDLFPLLEYEAPKAFYLGVHSTLLSEFDERTRQAVLASPEKAHALAALDNKALESVFAQYGTVNDELSRLLQWRRRGGPGPYAVAPADSIALGFFAPTNLNSAGPAPRSDTSGEIQQLHQALRLLDSDRKREGADLIATLLRARRDKSDWAPAPYAALAARASLATDDARKAREILELALPLAPQDPQLRFLAKIVAREANRPAELSSAK